MYRYIGRHRAVTPFKFPPLFKKPKIVEIPNRLGVSGSRFFKQFSSDTTGYSKSRFYLYFWKNASNKITFQIFAFLIIAAGL